MDQIIKNVIKKKKKRKIVVIRQGSQMNKVHLYSLEKESHYLDISIEDFR